MIYKQILNTLRQLGITETGFVSAETALCAIPASPGVFGYKKQVSDIEDILPGAKSIIVFLAPYNNGQKPVNLSMYATGTDYHIVCRKISEHVSLLLSENGYTSISFADNGPLRERTLAHLAGLGIIGKNGFLINKTYGSYTFIGYVVTDCPLPASTPDCGECYGCGKCIESCPGGALSEREFDPDKCISCITQKKGDLTENEIMLIKKGKSAWGCDICQNVCPMNEKASLTPLHEFNENVFLCIKNEYLSNREFKSKYSDRAFSWRGKSVIDRNLSILNDNKECR